jgi:L-threonylcarbamoyladenylate synthase
MGKAAQMKQTIMLKVDAQQPDIEKIRAAADIIRKGGLVAFPTETVYGLGADALNSKAVFALFKAKKRPMDNPPIIHVENVDDVYRLAKQVPPKADQLMKKFWPGPLTLVLKRSDTVPNVTAAGLNTIAIRMPQHAVALALIKESHSPIAAPSANLAGKPSPTSAEHVFTDLNGRIDAILDTGPTCIGVESTVLDLSVDPALVLRPGGTPLEALRSVLGNVELHPFVVAERELPLETSRSPGMKHKHYAPKAQVIVVEGALSPVMATVKSLISDCWLQDKRVGVLATAETAWAYEADVVKSLGSRRNVDAMAVNLFRLLREFDEEDVDVIVAEGVSTEGLGLAVMNRLRKASGYNIVKAG